MSAFIPKVLTVSQLNRHISSLIEGDPALRLIFIEGELSNLRLNAQSGHLYFSLKDRSGVVRAVMFNYAVKNLRFRPEDGMKVIMRAQLTVYEPMGQYQLKVEDMQPDGVGVLAMQFEQLKTKLNAEGLFDPAHKKLLPSFPRTVGIITSPTGAALQDMLDILSRRYPCADIVIAPVQVQGEGAPAQLTAAINAFSRTKAADVVIIGRGGGSMEDLWAFNDEGLARAIFACEVPVVSAVGHETDVTLCDYVSDLRAPTPSAAAELVVPNRDDLHQNIEALLLRGTAAVHSYLNVKKASVDQSMRVMSAYRPSLMLENRIAEIDSCSARAANAIDRKLSEAEASVQALIAKAEAMSPLAALNRGYAYVSKDQQPVSSIEDVTVGDFIDIMVSDGHITAIVTE